MAREQARAELQALEAPAEPAGASRHPASCHRARNPPSAASDSSSRSSVSRGSARTSLVRQLPLQLGDRVPVARRQAAAHLRGAPGEPAHVGDDAVGDRRRRAARHDRVRVGCERRRARGRSSPRTARHRRRCAPRASRAAAAPCPRSARCSVPPVEVLDQREGSRRGAPARARCAPSRLARLSRGRSRRQHPDVLAAAAALGGDDVRAPVGGDARQAARHDRIAARAVAIA